LGKKYYKILISPKLSPSKSRHNSFPVLFSAIDRGLSRLDRIEEKMTWRSWMETLTEVNIEQVWNHFFQHHDTASRNTLLEYYLPQVKYTATRLRSQFPQYVELDDLYSVGIFGLVDAINKFDPTRNVRFETYCVQRIKGTIYDDIRKNDRVPRLVRQRAKQLQEVTQRLETIFGRSPSDEELADELEMNMEDFYYFQRDANASSLISLNTNFSNSDGDEEFGELNIISDQKSKDPFIVAQKKDLKEFVGKGFSKQERLIVILYYFEQMTMREIGDTLGISESRVCQLHSSIIARLKSRLNLRSCLLEC
jgi:RNA polymerase sigma factor for flagellar operon FliA